MSDCPNCTEDEYCSEKCAEADEPCLHGMIELVAQLNPSGSVELARCLDCGELVRHTWVGSARAGQ